MATRVLTSYLSRCGGYGGEVVVHPTGRLTGARVASDGLHPRREEFHQNLPGICRCESDVQQLCGPPIGAAFLGGALFTHRGTGSPGARSERFSVLNFGDMTSPFLACQGKTRILDLVMHPPSNPTSVFQWKQVKLNCPFSKGCDPSVPSGSTVADRQ